MTIDDELLIELIKPNRLGEVGEGALIIKVVGTKNLKYKLEEPTHFWRVYGEQMPHFEREVVKIRPDITVTLPREGNKQIAIELENDVQWDFGQSLRQIKKYKKKFEDVKIIIPESYSRFAPLYKNEGFRVFLWTAKRKWKCLRCETVTLNESRVPPKCENKECKNKSRNEFDLVGLKGADINEY